MQSRSLRRVAVVGSARIPFCRSNTLYAELSNLDMMTAVLNGLVDKYSLKGVHIDEVVGGSVVTHVKDCNLAREAVLGTKLAPTTPGITIMQACGTSLQAALGIGAKIAIGEIECGICDRSDTTSDRADRVSSRNSPTPGTRRRGSDVRPSAGLQGLLAGRTGAAAASVSEPRTGLSHGPALRVDGSGVAYPAGGAGPARL